MKILPSRSSFHLLKSLVALWWVLMCFLPPTQQTRLLCHTTLAPCLFFHIVLLGETFSGCEATASRHNFMMMLDTSAFVVGKEQSATCYFHICVFPRHDVMNFIKTSTKWIRHTHRWNSRYLTDDFVLSSVLNFQCCDDFCIRTQMRYESLEWLLSSQQFSLLPQCYLTKTTRVNQIKNVYIEPKALVT